MYLYTESNKLYFDFSINEKAILSDLVKRAFKVYTFYKHDPSERFFCKAVEVLQNCYFLDYMDFACDEIIYALHTLLDHYFSATNYHDLLNHPLYAFFCEMDRYLYASIEA